MRARIASCSLIALALCAGSSSLARAQVLVVFPAGAYTITTPGPTTISQTATSITLSWGSPTPPTPPIPVPPAPVPTPVPTLSGHVWALAITDPSQPLTAAQQAALTSPTLQGAALAQDVSFQAFTKSDATVASWIPHLPVPGNNLLFITKDPTTGKGILVPGAGVAMPATEAAIIALINQIRGK